MKQILILSSLFIALNGLTQETVDQNFKTVTFKLFGYPMNGVGDCSCTSELKQKYGFEERRVAGCVVGPLRVWSLNSHNRRSERKMVRRHGENWREKYEFERRMC